MAAPEATGSVSAIINLFSKMEEQAGLDGPRD